MTTIAYKDGVIAYDSRSTSGELIRSDNTDKHKCIDGVHFFYAGMTCHEEQFYDMYLGKQDQKTAIEDSPSAIVVHDGKVLCAGADGDGLFTQPIIEECYVIGSGTPFAYGALDMGADAVTAVKMAAKRDCGTGGRIRTFKVK